MENRESDRNETRQKSRKRAGLCIMILTLLLAAVLIGYNYYLDKRDDGFDEKAGILNKEELYRDQLKEQLQEQADLSDFHFRVSGQGKFPNGTKKAGNLFIENPADNTCSMQVTIQDKKTQEVLYLSPVLAPGENVSRFPLKKELPAGEHAAVGIVKAMKEDTHEAVGEVTVDMKLTVE